MDGHWVIPKRSDQTHTRGVETMGYAVLPLDAIAALPVREQAERDAHLYLWTTNAFMVQAHAVARAWGFEPKTILTWVKMRHDWSGPSMRTGYYFRGATEHVIFAVRGSLRLRTAEGLPTAFFWHREQHSAKPDAFYDLVEQASHPEYLELFARRQRFNWSTWGNEAFKHVDLTVPA